MREIALIGTGQMAEIYAAILGERRDCRVRAVAGNTPDKTAAFAKRHGLAPYAAGGHAALYRDFPEIDTTIVTTPEWVRVAPIEAAVASRQHLLLEKPFAASTADIAHLRRLLEGYDRVFAICHVLRYSARFLAVKRAVEAGRIGELRHVFARRNSNRQRVRRVLGRTDLAYWLTPHDIDMIRWLTGSEIVEVFARSRAGLSREDDYLIAHLRCANGVDAVLECSWCAPPLSGTAREAVFELRGTKGAIELEDFDMNVRIFGDNEAVSAPDTYEHVDIQGATRGFFEPMIDHFLRRVAANDVDPAVLADAVATVEACGLIRRSLDSGAVARNA